MKIKIFKKNIFFTHLPRTKMVVPKTSLKVEISPAKIVFFNEKEKKEFFLDGIFDGFTIFLNMEKFLIEVRGFSHLGFVKYKIFYEDKKVFLLFEKADKKFSVFDGKKKIVDFLKKRILVPLFFEYNQKNPLEKLYLGCDKKQDMEMIKRRKDLKEILPIWFSVGNILPFQKKPLIEKFDERFFMDIFQTYFTGIFFPRKEDEDHYGKLHLNIKNPLNLLKEGSCLIKEIFFKEEKNSIVILPKYYFPSGRFINIGSHVGSFDLMWSNGILKKMVLRSKKDAELSFLFNKKIKTFRMRNSLDRKGNIFKSFEKIPIEDKKTYFFDRFQK